MGKRWTTSDIRRLDLESNIVNDSSDMIIDFDQCDSLIGSDFIIVNDIEVMGAVRTTTKIAKYANSKSTYKGAQRYLKYRDWKEKVSSLFCVDFDPISLDLVCSIKMPKSWSKKKKAEMNGKPHNQKPDIDNIGKAIMDACIKEDKAIYRFLGLKFWGYDNQICVRWR